MATKVEMLSTQETPLHRRPSDSSTLPPAYDSSNGSYELDTLTPSTTQTSLPKYNAVCDDVGSSSSDRSGFHPTKLLQIETQGIPVLRFPLPPRPDPIPVLSVMPDGEMSGPEYISIRPTRGSGNCVLVKGDDPQQTPLAATTYRFGPGKPPKIQLTGRASAAAPGYSEEFVVNSKGAFTRAVTMRTHLGTFEWRYASRAERKALDGDNVLILDRVTSVALAGGKQEELRRKVGQLVRSDETRTEGSKKCSAGNGGRLMIDLREWADCKGEAGEVEVLAVTSCIMMLKKEVDRRRMHQTMVIMGAASGGP